MLSAEPPSSEVDERIDHLVHAFGPVVRRYIAVRVSESVVDDLVARTFETAWQQDTLDLGRSELLFIARRHVSNYHRGVRRQGRLAESLSELGRPLHSELLDGYLAAEVLEPLISALELLSETDRRSIGMSLLSEVSPLATVAQTGAARVRLLRARRRLAEFYQPILAVPESRIAATQQRRSN